MRVLFVHHSFPGQFGMLLGALAAAGQHQLVFITGAGQRKAAPEGVTVVPYLHAATSFRTHVDARAMDNAMRRAAAVAEVGQGLLAAGFVPDVIIGHEGWGETLNLCDVWPGVPQIGLREYFYHETGADVGCDPEFPVSPAQAAGVRAKNALGLLGLQQGHAGVTPTEWQRGLYPAWAQPAIHLVPDAVRLDLCAPRPALKQQPFALGGLVLPPATPVVTYVARDLEPYRGFHTLMRAVPALLARPDVHVVCVGGTGVSYGLPPPVGTWRDHMLAEVSGRFDPARLHFAGVLPYADHIRLLQRSDVHLYLSYPFILSWSLREALACGCAVVAADTAPVREFVADEVTGVLVPALDPAATAAAVLALLDDTPRREALGAEARRWAEQAFTPARHLAAWREVILAACGQDIGDTIIVSPSPPVSV